MGKKVTLLKHFRNYLLQQNNMCNQRSIENNAFCINDNDTDHFKNPVFLKKWVRTKHAILFRLSNRTVQVVFYDHTEILLCSEGRVVTYVDKKMVRTNYHLGEIIKSGDKEGIKKRLKYVKDILSQMIIPIKSTQ